ncbi:MAG: hypothetical protein NBV68_13285 [Erythrobacter sp.]|uniref:hypothetical protein n=1 Tax=Erythrobacter sp. TaxID=1042 RepID=UPI0025EFD5F4|nr:hypothetical protein [Erythrobacter sp.]MCM0000352.1 hypothetical protein [Erythrobacter sp.]
MIRLKLAWCAALALAYCAFVVWYGGAGAPLTKAEGAAMLDAIGQMYRDHGRTPASTDFRANLAAMIGKDDGREFYMVNLETRKPGPEALAAEQRYGLVVLPLLLKRGSHPVFVADRVGLALGQYGAEIDRVGIVRYRSLRDFLDMNADPGLLEGIDDKFAALERTEVFITRPVIAAETIRLTLALLLAVIGWIGIKLIDWRSARRTAS